MSQFALLRRRRFGPFFATQFLGAFNDNLFKNAVVILFAFSGLSAADADALVNLAAGIFILPFFLFSAWGGQLADKFEKSRLIRLIKAAEIAIMALAAVGFFLESVPLLLVVLFLMGAQSTLFGPVKYSILPQQLEDAELVGGNGLVEMGTFVAILIGTIAGGLLIVAGPHGRTIVSGCVVAIACLGWMASRAIPQAPPPAPELRIRYEPFGETWRLIGFARDNRIVFWSIVAISWFWFYGALFLAQFPGFARSFVGGDEHVVTIMLAAFTVGIGVGSTLCERMSAGKLELGLVPLGAIGLSLFAVDLYLASPPEILPAGAPVLVGAREFLGSLPNVRIVVDLTLIGVFGGWFIVPLYTLMQRRSSVEHRSRVIAANNVLNALFMVVAAGVAIGLRAAGWSIPELFVATGVASAVVVVVLLGIVPEFGVRFVVWLTSRTLVRVRAADCGEGGADGGALLVAEDTGPVGLWAMAAAWPRSVRFVVPPHLLANRGLVGALLRAESALGWSAASGEPSPAFAEALASGQVLCVFHARSCPPRSGSGGAISTAMSVHHADEQVLLRAAVHAAVPIVPVAIRSTSPRGWLARQAHDLREGLLRARGARLELRGLEPVHRSSSKVAEDLWRVLDERLGREAST